MNYLYSETPTTKLYLGHVTEVLKTLDSESVNCVVTSPPYYGLRDYCMDKQIGFEATPKLYVDSIVEIFEKIKRVLKKDGTVWLNLGDTYVDSKLETSKIKLKRKNLIGLPWKVAFALQENDWYLRQDIIWSKPFNMPESVKDRCTKSHEYIFLLAKSEKYYYNADAIKELATSQDNYIRNRDNPNHKFNNTPGRTKMSGLKDNKYEYRNKRSVWVIQPKFYKEAHFAVFPEELPMNCIKAGCPPDGVVLDPFAGSGTTLKVAQKLNRKSIGIDINKKYLDLIVKRTQQQPLL